MNDFENALKIMQDIFSRDYQFALATSENDTPSLRFVDTYFDGECFYVVTYLYSQKVKEIIKNPNVALCSKKMHSFSGRAYNIGHPLLSENSGIREKLIEVFEPWYFKHNNENDSNMCYIKIKPTTGFFHKDGTGYKVNFEDKTVSKFPFNFDIVLTEE